MPPEPTTDEAITTAWRTEWPRLVAALTRLSHDVGLAEDLAQDALVAALEQWPRDGVPERPGAWLMTAARRRAVDHFRRAETLRRKTVDIGHDLTRKEAAAMADFEPQVDYIEDDVLRLVFLTCHPSLTRDSRAALTLRLVAGLTTAEIARGLLATESAMGQRISRAKKALASAGAEFELPTGTDREARLDDVMAVIYLVFNEGYTATSGEDWARPDLASEAIRLSRMLAALVDGEPEVHGLQALLELQASRIPARTDSEGRPVLLEDQDRTRWDELLVRRGLTALSKAEQLAAQGRPVGRYFLQAAIAAQHARSPSATETDWSAIAGLYDVLARAAPGPVVEVNRAVAHGRAFGSGAGLAVLDAIPPEGLAALAGSHLLPSVRGDLLARDGRPDEAAVSFREAAALTQNARERELLLRRAGERG